MPEENNDFEEIDEIVPNNNSKSNKDDNNVLNFNKKQQNLKASNLSQDIPNQNISNMPQNNISQTNIPTNNSTVESKKSNVLNFNRNKNKDTNEIASNEKISKNTTKSNDKLPLNKKMKNNKKDDISNNSSSSNKVGRKRFQSPVRRNNTSDDEEKTKDIEGNSDSNSKSEESKNKLSDKKNGVKSKLDKLKHPVQNVKSGVKNVAAEAVKKILKPIKIKLMMSIGALVGGLAVCFFVLYLILSPLMDIWPYIDETVRSGANFTEKFLNFFKGFGFEDSKEAFYEEAAALNEYYNNSLDMPLLLSTLFYPEIQNYNMDYEEHLAVDNGDPITSLLSGGPTGFVNFIKNWIKDIHNETTTTFDENGLAYNANKIFRLRRLAAAMADRDIAEEKTVPLIDFLLGNKQNNTPSYVGMFGKALKDALWGVPASILSILQDTLGVLLSEILDLITFDFEAMEKDFEQYIQNIKDAGGNIYYVIAQLINVASFGFCTITSISFHPIDALVNGSLGDLITVTYKPYKFNKEKYDAYVKDYYFENTIEYSKLLPEGEPQRTNEKNKLLNEIYVNKETFEQIFLDYNQNSSEEYMNSCVGAIDPKLVNVVQQPVKIPEGTKVSFIEDSGFGIREGRKHNGVDLNSATAGVNEGDSVYAIADGEVVESEPDVSCNTFDDPSCSPTGAWVKIKHTVRNDTDEYTFYSVYMHLQTNSGQPEKGKRVTKGQVIGKVGNTGRSTGAHLHFEFHNSNDVAIDPTNLFVPCNSGHYNIEGYPNATKVVNAIIANPDVDARMKDELHLAAILGNLSRESGGGGDPNPECIERGPETLSTVSASHGSGHAIGIVQWDGGSGSRKDKLIQYAQYRNKNWYDIDLQIEYYITELTGKGDAVGYASFQFMNKSNSSYYNLPQASYEGFLNSSDLATATMAFAYSFERPAVWTSSKESPRITYARKFFELLQKFRTSSEGTTQLPSDGKTLVWPTPKTPIGKNSSRFGYRTSPRVEYHHGEDIPGSTGDPIVSASNGTVCGVGSGGERGNHIIIFDESTSTKFVYQHMASYPTLTVGEKVTAGQQIGIVGNTGYSLSPHLHFEIHINDSCSNRIPWMEDAIAANTVDPMNYNYISASSN